MPLLGRTLENKTLPEMIESSHASFFSSEEMEGIFKETFGPPLEQRAFVYVGKNRWVRETGGGFKHLFYLYPFRPGLITIRMQPSRLILCPEWRQARCASGLSRNI